MVIHQIDLNKSVTILTALLLSTASLLAQDDDAPFPEFNDYKRWGYHIGFMVYDATKNVDPTGPYVLDHKPQKGFSVGFTKHFKADHKISYKTGIYYQSTPVYRTSITFRNEDVFFQDETPYDFTLSRFNFHVPLLAQFKKQLDRNLYFNIETGLMLALIQPGGASGGILEFVTSLEDKRDVFGIKADNITSLWVLPNVIISPGIYYRTEAAMYQLNVIYQNSIIRYYEGRYVVDNLAVSERSESKTTLSGDYIGISFNVHLRKKGR